MTALEQIHQMPLQEKLLIVEVIWDDILYKTMHLEIPQWHKEILDERERLLAEGKAQFIDWEEAKEQIKKSVQ